MHRATLVVTTAVLTVILFIILAPTPLGRTPTPFDARMRYLIAWIAARSDYSVNVPLPRIQFLSRERINHRYYSRRKEGYRGQNDIQAMYDGVWQVIILPTSFDFRWDEPILVHELVHHLQRTHWRIFRCQEEQEREAYLIQRRYVQETGIGMMPDWTFIMSLRCAYR